MSRTVSLLPAASAPPRRQATSDHFTRRLEESIWLAPGILLIVCALLFFYGLNAGELYRNESLRAIIAAEFLRSGNWIVPTLYGEPLFTKPPGMYAAIALVSWPFGAVHEWTARLPSALAATITVFLVYRLFRRHFGRRALPARQQPLQRFATHGAVERLPAAQGDGSANPGEAKARSQQCACQVMPAQE